MIDHNAGSRKASVSRCIAAEAERLDRQDLGNDQDRYVALGSALGDVAHTIRFGDRPLADVLGVAAAHIWVWMEDLLAQEAR